MAAPSNSNNWFVGTQTNPQAEMRLFLFPYAGGGPAVFNNWTSEFPGSIEVCIAHYPGRGSRHHEPPISQITILAERYALAIQPLLDKPFVFFGHSLGGLIAFELARQMRQQKLSQPLLLFISACGAPHLPDPNPPIHGYSDAEFMRALQQLNGVPPALLGQPNMIQLLLPMLRTDFEAIECYRHNPAESPLSIPIIAFAGADDPRVGQERIEGWALHTDAGFQSQYFPGDHFFMNTGRESVISAIAAELQSAA